MEPTKYWYGLKTESTYDAETLHLYDNGTKTTRNLHEMITELESVPSKNGALPVLSKHLYRHCFVMAAKLRQGKLHQIYTSTEQLIS